MSAVLGELVVSLSANMAQFTSAMEKAAYEAQQKSKRIEAAFAAAESAIKAVGIAAAGVVFTRMIMGAADLADQVGKLSQKTGIATETLSAYRYAASLSDLSNEDLEKSLIKLNVKMGEARDGSKEAQAALARFGVDANLDSPAEAFAKIADRVQATGDSAVTASAMNDVFGKSFAALIPLLQGGSQGLKEAAEEAAQFGQIIGPDFAAQAQQFNDNMTRMQAGLGGLHLQIGNAVMPVLAEFTNELVSTGKEMGGFSVPGAVVKTVLETLIVLGSEIAFVFRGVGNEIGGIAAQAAALARLDFRAVGEIHRMMVTDSEKARADHDAFIARVMNPPPATQAQATLTAPIKAVQQAAVKAKKEVDAFLVLFERLTAKSAGLSPDFSKSLDTLYAGWQKGRIGVEDYRAAVEELIQEQPFARELEQEAQKAARQQEQRAQEIENLRQSLLTQEEAIRESYERRRKLVEDNTPAGSDQQTGLLARIQADYEASLQAMEDARRRARDQLYQGLLTEEEALVQSYERRRAAILSATEIAETERQELLARLQAAHDKKMLEVNGSYWDKWLAAAEKNMGNFDEMAGKVAENASKQFGDFFESVIFDSSSAQDAIYKLAEGMLRTIVNALGQMAAQWLIYKAVQASGLASGAAAGASAMSINAEAQVLQAGLNAFASTAAIPIVGPELAPAAMSAAMAATEPLAAGVASLAAMAAASSFAGAFDAGGTIPAGKFGLVGERGPEIIHGPASVTGRQDTARMLRDLSGRELPAPPPAVNVKNIVLMDTDAVIGNYLGGSGGDRVFVTMLGRNPEAVRRAVGS